MLRSAQLRLHELAAGYLYRPGRQLARALRPEQRAAYRAFRAGMTFRRSAQRWSADRRREWMLVQLRSTVRYAHASTPFYRARFAAAGFDPSANFSFADYAALPILDRSDISDAGDRIISTAVPQDRLREDATGGSTGTPTRLWKGPLERGWSESGIEFFMRRIELPTGSRIGYLWGHHLDPMTRASLRDRVEDHLNNVRWFDCLRLEPELLDAYHRDLQLWRPRALIAYASALAPLAEAATRAGTPPAYPSVGFVTGAEKVLPHHRELVEQVFARPVYERYGSRDGGLVGFQTDPRRSLDFEIDWANAYIEAETDEPTASLLITKLHADGMPMLRYRIGDLARFPDDTSPGTPALFLHEVVGRAVQRLWLPTGGWVHGLGFPHLFKDFPVRDFQVAQAEDLSVEVRLVATAGFGEAHEIEIKRLLRANLPGVPITLQLVSDIPRSKANKWQPVVSAVRVPRPTSAAR